MAVSLACVGCTRADFAAFRRERLGLPERREPVILAAVGDIMLSRGVAQEIRKRGDVGHPFSGVIGYLRGADVVFGNLECPLTPGPEIGPRDMILRADPGLRTALAESGFTVLSLANNHALDFGADGLADTLRNLQAVGVECVGAGWDESEAYGAAHFEVGGIRLAFLAYCEPGLAAGSPGVTGTAGEGAVPGASAGTAPGGSAGMISDAPVIAVLDLDRMRAGIREARERADYVVVSMHVGTEYSRDPDSTQVQYARAAVDAGADLVIGHHPHVVQRAERYRDAYIFYSLGNFVFDQVWSRATREGVAVRIFIGSMGLERIELAPVIINGVRPEILRGEEAEAVLSRLSLDVERVVVRGEGGDECAERYTVYPPGPRPGSRTTKRCESDLDADGRVEEYLLRDGRLTITVDREQVWQSPEDWWVDDFTLGDADNDGARELGLSVWKEGSFGPDRPFWVHEEDRSVRNHLFIFRPAGGSLKAVWQSSNLDRPNYAISLEDFDGDGLNELVTVEGDYSDPGKQRTGVWRWSGWGFSRVSEP
ncbi:MAG: CapA family protein [Firmicutes bacterium]|nr:CapA family protein [Bacillota bacterium]